MLNIKILNNLLLILFFIILHLKKGVSLPDKLDFVYNSQPYKVFDVTENKGTSECIKIAKFANVVAIAIGKAGIMIIDSQFKQTIFQSPDKSFIQSVQITGDAKYVFSAMKNKVGVFEMINNNELKLISTVEVNDITVTDMQFYQNEDILFIISQFGVLQWYDIRNKQNIKQIDEIVQNQMMFSKGLFSPDQRLFYVVADIDGLLVFKIKNINQSNQNDGLSIKLERIFKKHALSILKDIVVTNKNEYIFAIDKWNGIFLLHKFTDLLIEGDDLEEKNSKIIIMEQAKLDSQGFTTSIDLSSNSQYLFIGVRSQGVLIYNVNDPYNPTFFQQLQLSGQSVSLRLSPQLKQGIEDILDNKYIFYSNSFKVIVYQKQLPVLYSKTPNLFNMQQSKLFNIGAAVSKWRCNVSPNNKYFYGGFDTDTLVVLKLFLPEKSGQESVKMQLQYQFSDSEEIMERVDNLREFGPNESVPDGLYVIAFEFSKDGKYLYFPSTQYELKVIAYKFEIIKSDNDEYSFKYIQALKYEEVYFCEQFNISEDDQHAIMSYYVGILIVDMVKFEVIAQLNNIEAQGNVNGAVFSHDKKHALSVVRSVGLYIYDTSNLKNPKLVNSWRTFGGETLLRSAVDNVIFFVDGFNGIILLDSTKFPEIVVMSQIVPSGWSNYISFTIKEDYGIISTMDTGMLTLIDLQDRYNPRLIMKSSIEKSDSIASCLDPTGKEYGFIVNKIGVRYFTMQSYAYIHVERQIIELKTQNYIMMNENEPFEVGNQYIIRFVTLNRKQNQIITDIYYYKNLVLSALPSWIQIDREKQTNGNLQTIIKLEVSKDCLESQFSKISFLIIVIKTCFQLSDQSFIFNTQTLSTTKEESLTIYKYLKSTGYINGVNCTTDFFDPTIQETLPLDDVFHDKINKEKQTIIEKYVIETLKKSTIYNQFIFDVISSLKFNQKNQDQMVQAFQNYISLSLNFPQFSPFIFVQKTYPNLIIYFNDELTSMKIEGELKDINQALQSKILFFDQSVKDDYIQSQTINKTISLQIIDHFNYDLSYSLKIPEEVFFFKEKSPIQLQQSLLEQLEKQYENSEFYIETAFLIAFDTQSFIDPDDIPLVYEIQQEINGEYGPLPNDSFIKFDNNNLRLFGTPTSKELFIVSKLRLIAKNRYTTLKEDFSLKINKIPFSYVFNIILQIVGPAAFIFGLYKKRSVFMNIYFKKKTMYTTEAAYVNQIYRKKISIIGYDYELAHLFFQKFLKIRNKQIQKKETANYEYQLNTPNLQNLNDNNQDKIEKVKLDCYQSPIETKNNSELNILSYDQKIQEEKFTQPLSIKEQNIPQISENRNLNNYNITEYQQNTQQDKIFQITSKYKSEVDFSNQDLFKRDERNVKNEIYLSDIKFFHSKINQNSNFQENENNHKQHRNFQNQNDKQIEINDLEKINYLFIKNLVVKDDGQIEIEKLFDLMLKYQLKISYKLQTFTIQNYKSKILNQKNRFFYCLRACIIRYLVQYDQKTSSFHRFLKRYSLKQGIYFENDWYKQYVSIIATNDLDAFKIPIPFSKTILKEDSLFEIYLILEFIPSNLKKENFQYLNIAQFQINPHLLREILFADALGLDQVNDKSIVRCKGQSLHLEKHTIISVEAYKLVEQGHCMCIRRILNMNYQRLPISKYQSIPSWMAYDYKNGVIVIEGIPSEIDINHILIRVFDENHFATYQFHLKIEDNPNQFVANNEDLINYNKDENALNQVSDMSSEYKLLSRSISIQNRSRQLSQQVQSIFKTNYQLIEQITAKDSIKESNETSHNLQIYKNNEQDEKNEEEIKIQISEMDSSVKSPPLFTHSPRFQGDFLSINQKNSIQTTNQKLN